MRIEARNLTKHFGRTCAVDGISFVFDSGHVFGFVGPNGAGKTTTLRMLATLEDPDDGDVTVDGVSVRNDPEKVRHLVGFVPDSLPAHTDITVLEYLDFFARAYGMRGTKVKRAVDEIVEFTNLGELRHKTLKALSKGMKQRVSVGRALIHNPPVLLMDEPAAGLDPRARVELRELIVALAGHGKALLVSSHILTELTEICTGVIIIEKGKILETGTLDDVLERRRDRRTLVMRALGDAGGLEQELILTPHVLDVKQEGQALAVEFGGDDEAAAALLAALIGKGHQLIEFRALETDLEDLFMTITKGNVQ